MNIPYESLITEANRRKDALKTLESVLNEVPHITLKAHDLQAFALRYKNAIANLDAESRKLIPLALKNAMDSAQIHLLEQSYNSKYVALGGTELTRGLLQLNDYLGSVE